MSDVIGKGIIEVSADSTKLKAGIDDAKRSIRGLGKDIGDSVSAGSAKATKSIDNYVRRLQTAAATNGMSARQSELYALSLRGASKAQLEAADSALKLSEGYEKGQRIGAQLRVGFVAIAAAATAASAAIAAGTIALINQVGAYQDIGEKIGDTAVNVSSLKTAADVSGTSIDTIAAASVKLTASLSKTDDESKLVAESVQALGLNFQKFKSQSPVEQLQSVAQAFDKFADGSEKTAVAVGLFGKSGAELLSFLKEYSTEGLKAAYVTAEQAKAADDFSDASARLKSQIEQFLQVSAVNAIPILVEVGDLFRSIGKEQEGAGTATEIVKGAISGLLAIFQAVVVVGSDVIFVFKGVGNEIGAIAAQAAALAQLDFKGFSAISDAVKDDAARARAELDKFQARVMALGTQSAKFADPRILGNPGSIAQQAAANRPRLDIKGLNRDKGKKDNSAAQEAKAQLALDLDDIRKAQDALVNTISNGEKVLEAERSANLVSLEGYYAARRGYIEADTAVQEAALQREIARLQRENLSGKDRIDNDRKVLDAQAKLAKLRENSTTNLQVLAIKEKDALAEIERGYIDATAAAQTYLDTVKRANAREIAGVGAGQKARDQSGSISAIEEKFEAQRQLLQRDNRNGKFAGRQADYQRELDLLNSSQTAEIALYRAKYQTLDDLQKDWTNGAKEALQNYIDESADVAKQTEDLFRDALGGIEAAFVELALTGKTSFKDLANAIIADLARIAIKQQITAPLAELFKGAMSGGGGSGGDSGSWVGMLAGLLGGGRAIGGPVHAGGIYPVNEKGRPEVLTAGGKEYLLTGNQGGNVAPASGGSSSVSVTNNFAITGAVDQRSQQQIAAAAGSSAQRALARSR